jgi:hypothetical protein
MTSGLQGGWSKAPQPDTSPICSTDPVNSVSWHLGSTWLARNLQDASMQQDVTMIFFYAGLQETLPRWDV